MRCLVFTWKYKVGEFAKGVAVVENIKKRTIFFIFGCLFIKVDYRNLLSSGILTWIIGVEDKDDNP